MRPLDRPTHPGRVSPPSRPTRPTGEVVWLEEWRRQHGLPPIRATTSAAFRKVRPPKLARARHVPAQVWVIALLVLASYAVAGVALLV